MSKFDPYSHLGVSLNPDGTLTRTIHCPVTEANLEPSPGIPTVSKDLTLDQEKKTWLRIFRPTKLPSNDNTVARLPILIYFHTGGWAIHDPSDFPIHAKCSQISSDIPAIVVSVAYRHAPESRLPAQYQDARDAILWVKKQMNDPDGEQWVKDYGDPSRCYLFGCGCGGNIAFNTAMQVADLDLEPLRISGVILNQPMFGGEKRTSSELRFATDQILPLPVLDLMWELVLPKETDRDHRYCNPLVKGPHLDMVKKLKRVLIIGYGGDILVDRQQDLVTMLVKCGVQVEARFDPVGFHNIDMVDPSRASAVINIVKEFIF
ncbi:hypothetical protein TanjilG_18585 [Lupinus angustifolius]|uniref:Alpha/beta hydrolase fold-3 domain-containing protein n=1 Tax=Lupinus angustifolius TaxID=3871 RepID=A0A394DK97_LUPAN|nr:PREDICTED: probable carboxylesterase 9 [Lupinus angustifolius]OIW20647.1 hypothetical protein TanjilG_18585 [Lupinus angustifolius]